MIINFKIFESKIDDVNYIFKIYEENKLEQYLIDALIKRYKIPNFLYDDFCVLYWFYTHSRYWMTKDKKIDSRIKRSFKSYILNKIVDYFNDNIETYFELKNLTEDTHFFDMITNESMKYVFYMFDAALRRTPDIIKNTEKYNI